jgi:hypothetical protein
MPARHFVLTCALCAAASVAIGADRQLYKGVDEKGNDVYSDRPAKADHSPEKKKTTNVASPEATRQLETERQEMMQRRREEEARARQFRQQQERASRPPPSTSRSVVRRTDPNLPDTPPPSSDRRYYYSGR